MCVCGCSQLSYGTMVSYDVAWYICVSMSVCNLLYLNILSMAWEEEEGSVFWREF